MTRTVADRMAESAGRGWVGRERELGALLTAATAIEPPFLVAFVQIAELDQLDPQLLAADPVARAWRAHLLDHSPAADDRVLVMRRWLGGESGELRSPAVSACWLDVKRVYMHLRPRLRRIYSVVVDLPRLAPIFVPLGFAPAGDPVMIDDTAHQPVWLDFGPDSVDGWLAGLIGAEATQPGLPAKIWLTDPADARHGGVYLFDDTAAADAFLGSTLAHSVATNPHFAQLTVRRFDVDETTTARTQPGITVVTDPAMA